MPRTLLLLLACSFLAQPVLTTLPVLPPGSDPGLLGKWLVARARARVRGEAIPNIEDMMPKSEPKMSIDITPVDVPIMNEMDNNNNEVGPMDDQMMHEGRGHGINEEMMEGDREGFPEEQFSGEESFVGARRRNKPPTHSKPEKETHLKPGKHYPEGYPDRSEKSKDTMQVVFPVNPSDSARSMHRVLDSPLPKPGEGPTYTVFVRASEHPSHGPTVHIVKHSVQTIMPIESQDELANSNHKLNYNVGKPANNLRRPNSDDPEDVLGAAKRDLIFRSGNLYGVPNYGRYGHQDPYDAFGHDSRHAGIHINLADFDSAGGYGHGGLSGLGHRGLGYGGGSGYGGLGHDGLGHGGLGHGGLGHDGLGYGGLGHGGLGHGGLGHGGLGHGGLGPSYGHGSLSGLGHSGLGQGSYGHGGLGGLTHGGLTNIGHGGYGQSGFSHGSFGHGAYDQGAFAQDLHAQDVLDHDTFSHSTYSDSTHGESLHGHAGFGLGIHGNHNYGNVGGGAFEQGYSGYGLRASETAHRNAENHNDPTVGMGLPPNMLKPYMGLLDMKGERNYDHISKQENAKPHCFPPYCPIHTHVEQPIYY